MIAEKPIPEKNNNISQSLTNSFLSDKPSRITLLLATWLYSISLSKAHSGYLNEYWEYYGFTYRPMNLIDIFLSFGLITIGAIAMPISYTRASSIVLMLLYIVVYVPTITLTMALNADRWVLYAPSLIALCFGFTIACVATRIAANKSAPSAQMPSETFTASILLIWVLSSAILFYNYRAILSFANLDDVYQQRAAGAVTNPAIGYLKTYYSNVFSPTLLAIGLVKRRYYLAALGAIGCIFMYTIDAQRTVFLLPIIMIGLYFALRNKSPFWRMSAMPVSLVTTIVLICDIFGSSNAITGFMSQYVIFRTLGLPGLTFSQYHDLFAGDGLTWWSHIRGLDLVISAPPAFYAHPAWPNLGYIVGDYFYGNLENNANANLFSGDGVAAAGPFGVVVAGLALSVWLVLLDRISAGWSRLFVTLVIFPVGFSLTNGHLSTVLLSFGGIFWLIIFSVYRPQSPPDILRYNR